MQRKTWQRVIASMGGALSWVLLLAGSLVLSARPVASADVGAWFYRSATTPHTGQIGGEVRDGGGTPLAQIIVSAYRDEGGSWQWVADTQTDNTGRYTLATLPAGTYRVGFWDAAGAFLSEYYNDKATLGAADDLSVTDGSAILNINATLAPASTGEGRMVGRVTGPAGVPLAGIEVTLYYSQTDGWQSAYSVTTGPSGGYEVSGLATGFYRVRFSDPTEAYGHTYYQNAGSLGAATDINIIGATRARIDAVMAPAGHIAGVITGPFGEPFVPYRDSASLQLLRYDGASWQTVTYEWSYGENAGNYHIGGLSAGVYRLWVSTNSRWGSHQEWYNDTSDQALATPITVTPGTTTTINMNVGLSSTSWVTGTVRTSDGLPRPNIGVMLYVSQTTGWTAASDYWPQTSSSGEYVAWVPGPGLYVVSFLDLTGELGFEFHGDAPRPSAATPLSITTGMVVSNINATLEPGARITGTITDPTGAPYVPHPYNASIGAEFRDGNNWYPLPYWAGTRINPGGGYTVQGLAPGDYRLSVNASHNGYFYSEFYDDVRDPALATPVTVGAGETVSDINVSLGLGGVSWITGQVLDDNGAPLPDINVMLHVSATHLITNATTTASDGRFRLGVPTAGVYTLGYQDPTNRALPEYHDNAPSLAAATPLTVGTGVTLTNVNAVLSLGGAITGVVRGPFGAPLHPNTYVDIYVWEHGDEDFWPAYTTSTSGRNGGLYTLSGLLSGTYAVHMSTSCCTVGYYGEIYNDVDEYHPELATPVTVTGGLTTTNINFNLGREGVSRLMGSVQDTSGQPLSGINVSLYTTNTQGSWWPVGQATTTPSGTYILGVPTAGHYTLGFSDPAGLMAFEYYENATSLASATVVSIGEGITLADINAELAPAGRITGTVSGINGSQLHGYAEIAAEMFDGVTWQTVAQTPRIAGGGASAVPYELGGLPTGEYRMRFFGFSNGILHNPEWFDDQNDPTQATLVSVTAGATTPDISASLGPSCRNRLSGQVTGPGGQPLADIQVKLYQNYYGSLWWYLVYAETDTLGQYSIGCLQDGEYRVAFADPTGTYATQFYSMTADLESATSVTLTDGTEATGIDGVLINAGIITGQVERLDGAPVQAATVWGYRWNGTIWSALGRATTNDLGQYTMGGLAAGTYRLLFLPAPQQQLLPEYFSDTLTLASATDINVVADQTTPDINALLAQPAPPVAQIVTRGGVTFDPRTGQATIRMAPGSRADITITAPVACPDGTPPSAVLLLLNSTSYPMVETPPGSGLYSATIPASQVVSGTLTVQWQCGDATHTLPIGTIVLYDPSGYIRDAGTGEPIPNATVMLYRVPGWRPRTSPTDGGANTCESNASKPADQPWGQPAPTELGIWVNPEVEVLNGSPQISPTINPQMTDATGHYGWDVATGCWYIEVSAPGYEPLISPVVGVPPAVTDLDLALTPQAVCLGDVDNDQDRDLFDIQTVALAWNHAEGQSEYQPAYDLDQDGDVDIGDVQQGAGVWAQDCPTLAASGKSGLPIVAPRE